MHIRHASLEDLDIIFAIENKSYPPLEGATRESIKKRLTVFPTHFWLLEEQGEVLSFVNGMVTNESNLTDEMYTAAHLHQATGKWQMIFSVATKPRARKQGCASKLLKAVIADAKSSGQEGVVLTCKKELINFYNKFGFCDEGISSSTHGAAVWHQMRLKF